MSKIIGNELKNLPWEPKPADCVMPVWRYSGNPIIGRHAIKRSNSVFNSAVVPFGDGFAGVFRCDSRSVSMDIFPGFSKDGVHWEIQDEPVHFEGDPDVTVREYRYDPRVCLIDGKYYVTWCNGYHGLQDLPPAGERFPALQPQRRAVPPEDQWSLYDALPAQRHGPYAFR